MFNINIDLSELNDILEVQPQLKRIADEASQELAKMAMAKAKEMAAQKLHTRRKMYQDGVFIEKVEDGAWFVALKKNVRWIDDGQTPYDMIKYLLNGKGKVHTDKQGNRYVVVPFDHSPGGKGGSDSRVGRTSAEQDLVNAIKKEFKKDEWKKQGITFGGIEKDANGNDRIGRLHTFSLKGPAKKDPGPGQRRGPVGEAMQGSTGTPFLHGVTVYQHKDKAGKTQRSIVTFRVASEKHRGQGKWEHPGNAPVDILEKAAEEAVELWTKEIAPLVLDKALSGG